MALAVIVTVAVVAPAVAAPTASATATAADDSAGRTESVDIDPALRGASGTVEAVVRFPPADTTRVADRRAALRRHAERSQSAFLAAVDERPGVSVERTFWVTNAVLVTLDTDTASVESLADVDGVARVHRNHGSEQHHATAESGNGTHGVASTAPASQHGQSAASGATRGVERVAAPQTWEFHDTRGGGAAVAVLDSGVDPSGHPGIEASLDRGGWAEFDGRTGERVDSEPNDPNGHGTRVSGAVVGGTTDEGVAYGVAPEAALYHAKVMDEQGYSFASITAGLQWAVDNDVDVVSMSIGGIRYGGEFAEPVQNARDAGVLVVGSIGNAGQGTSVTPANLPTAVGVGAVDANGSVPEWSGGERIDTARYWGREAPDSWPAEYVVPEVTAPGSDITLAEPGGGYTTASGASYAAPLAAGAAALAASATGAEGPRLNDALIRSAQHPADRDSFAVSRGPADRYGAGVVNAMAATSLLLADEELSGTVTTPDGEPIAGAVVASEAGVRTRTDERGRYTLSVPSGEQPIAAAVVGRETAVQVVDPASTDTTRFELEPAAEAQAELRGPMATRVDPGGVATAEFETAGAETITVEAETTGPLSTDALTLRIDGQSAEFGEPFEVQDDWRRGIDIEIGADGEAPPGSVRPHVTFEGGGETVSGRLDPLYVHSNPFRIGPEFPVGLQEPVNLFAPGTTIALEDGSYEATGDGSAPLVVDRPVSLVAAEGADPTVVAEGTEAGVLVTDNDVELRGLRIEADGAAAGVQVGTRGVGRETEAPSGVTVADNEVVGATDGIVTFGAPTLWIERNRIEATGNGTRIAGPQRAAVRNNEITGATVGIAIEGRIIGVSNNRVADAETGIVLDVPIGAIEALGGGFGTIDANTVEDADEGVRIVGAAPDGAVGDNTFRNVDDERVGSTGGVASAADVEDSPLGAVLYGSAALTVGLLFVPYGLRRFRRR
jgi:hypothetical protein